MKTSPFFNQKVERPGVAFFFIWIFTSVAPSSLVASWPVDGL